MHRALAIPEIVGAIFQSGRDEIRLYSCLFVNQFFFAEAARLIWSFYDPNGLVSLALVNQTNPIRAQFYASFMQYLYFEDPGVYKCLNYSLSEPLYTSLLGLKFPLLKVVHFNDPDIKYNIAQHYLQPTILNLHLGSVRQLPDSLFQSIRVKCPSLQTLQIELAQDSENTLSEQGILESIMNCTSLNTLHYRLLGFNLIQPMRSSHSILSGCVIHTPPNLTSLNASISVAGCRCLLPHLSALKSLSLWELRGDIGFQRVPGIIALSFTNLTHIHVQMSFSEITFSGDELVLLAQNCRNIQVLDLNAIRNMYIQDLIASDIDDDLIEKIAQNLPELTRLYLRFGGLKLLTLKSLQSLATHCRSLQNCEIAMDLRWEDLGRRLDLYHQALEDLAITSATIRSGEANFHAGDRPNNVELREAAIRFTSSFPNIKQFFLAGNHNTNGQFQSEVYNIIKERGLNDDDDGDEEGEEVEDVDGI